MPYMQLSLISGNTVGQENSYKFTNLGGTIGRSADCDWTLIDNDRFISNKHILLSFQNNQFVLTDVSSNGVFINNSETPLGKGNTHLLQQGDRISLGKFCLEVTDIILETFAPTTTKPQDSQLLDLVTGTAPTGSDPITPDPAAIPSNDGLGLFDILSGDGSAQQPTAPVTNTIADPIIPEEPEVPPSFTPQNQTIPAASTIPEDWDLDTIESSPADVSAAPTPAPAQPHTPMPEVQIEEPPQSPAPKPSSAATSIPQVQPEPEIPAPPQQAAQPSVQPSAVPPQAAQAEDAFFALLYEKLSLPKEYIGSVNKEEFAQDLADILMTSTQGLMSLLAGRSVFKQESRLSMTMIKPQSNNPIKFSLDPSDILEKLLVKKKAGYMTAQAAYAEALSDIQMHQMAFLSGLQGSLTGILNELSPEEIDKLQEKKGKSFLEMKAASQKWDLFMEKHEELVQLVNENLNEVLSKHFSEAYEAQINTIKSR